MNVLLFHLLNLLYPPKCVFCSKLLQTGETDWCGVCQRTLPWVEEHTSEKTCAPATRCVAPLWYRGVVRESLHRYKFEGRDFLRPGVRQAHGPVRPGPAGACL